MPAGGYGEREWRREKTKQKQKGVEAVMYVCSNVDETCPPPPHPHYPPATPALTTSRCVYISVLLFLFFLYSFFVVFDLYIFHLAFPHPLSLQTPPIPPTPLPSPCATATPLRFFSVGQKRNHQHSLDLCFFFRVYVQCRYYFPSSGFFCLMIIRLSFFVLLLVKASLAAFSASRAVS